MVLGSCLVIGGPPPCGSLVSGRGTLGARGLTVFERPLVHPICVSRSSIGLIAIIGSLFVWGFGERSSEK